MKPLGERMRVPSLLKRDPGWFLRAGMIACALVALALLIIARVTAPDPATASAQIGHPAPTFTLPAAQGGSKLPTPIHFSGAGAHPTMLIFFNTLCIHCLNEIRVARQVAAMAPNGQLDVVFIDTPGENAQITGAYMARLQHDPPVLLDAGGAVAREYGVRYAPTLTLVDRHGVIRGVWVGETSAATLTAGIHQALGG